MTTVRSDTEAVRNSQGREKSTARRRTANERGPHPDLARSPILDRQARAGQLDDKGDDVDRDKDLGDPGCPDRETVAGNCVGPERVGDEAEQLVAGRQHGAGREEDEEPAAEEAG